MGRARDIGSQRSMIDYDAFIKAYYPEQRRALFHQLSNLNPPVSSAAAMAETGDRPRQLMIYIAGPVTGCHDNNRAAFTAAADRLRQQGYSVFNPTASNMEGRPLREIMAYLLPQLCQCDAIAMLPGWWRSGGARIEWALARYLGLNRIRITK